MVLWGHVEVEPNAVVPLQATSTDESEIEEPNPASRGWGVSGFVAVGLLSLGVLGYSGSSITAPTVVVEHAAAPLGGLVKLNAKAAQVDLSCPEGSEQVGEINADIGGCGISECKGRYGLPDAEACRARCEAADRCKSFTWAPVGGDQNHMEQTVCTMYAQVAPTSKWRPSQIFCGLTQVCAADPDSEKTRADCALFVKRASNFCETCPDCGTCNEFCGKCKHPECIADPMSRACSQARG